MLPFTDWLGCFGCLAITTTTTTGLNAILVLLLLQFPAAVMGKHFMPITVIRLPQTIITFHYENGGHIITWVSHRAKLKKESQVSKIHINNNNNNYNKKRPRAIARKENVEAQVLPNWLSDWLHWTLLTKLSHLVQQIIYFLVIVLAFIPAVNAYKNHKISLLIVKLFFLYIKNIDWDAAAQSQLLIRSIVAVLLLLLLSNFGVASWATRVHICDNKIWQLNQEKKKTTQRQVKLLKLWPSIYFNDIQHNYSKLIRTIYKRNPCKTAGKQQEDHK